MKEKDSKIKAIRVMQNFPNIDTIGRLIGYDTFYTNIYYYNDQVLYNDLYHWGPIEQAIHKTPGFKPEIRENFFVYTKSKTHGYLNDKYKSEIDKKVLVDSILEHQWCNVFHFKQIFSKSTVTLLSQDYNENSGILNRVYSFKGIEDTSFEGSCSLMFINKIKNVEYSLSKELDTAKNMKLFKIKIINHSRYIKEYQVTLDQIEQIFEIVEIPINNKKEILYYFNKERKYNTGN